MSTFLCWECGPSTEACPHVPIKSDLRGLAAREAVTLDPAKPSEGRDELLREALGILEIMEMGGEPGPRVALATAKQLGTANKLRVALAARAPTAAQGAGTDGSETGRLTAALAAASLTRRHTALVLVGPDHGLAHPPQEPTPRKHAPNCYWLRATPSVDGDEFACCNCGAVDAPAPAAPQERPKAGTPLDPALLPDDGPRPAPALSAKDAEAKATVESLERFHAGVVAAREAELARVMKERDVSREAGQIWCAQQERLHADLAAALARVEVLEKALRDLLRDGSAKAERRASAALKGETK